MVFSSGSKSPLQRLFGDSLRQLQKLELHIHPYNSILVSYTEVQHFAASTVQQPTYCRIKLSGC